MFIMVKVIGFLCISSQLFLANKPFQKSCTEKPGCVPFPFQIVFIRGNTNTLFLVS